MRDAAGWSPPVRAGTPAGLPVLRRWSDLTPEWMTSALADRFPGAVVRAVQLYDVEDGTNRRARVRLSYAEGPSPRPGAGIRADPRSSWDTWDTPVARSRPPALFVKMQGRVLHRLALLALRAGAVEARLALSGLALPLAHPETYAASVDGRRLAAAVVMEDVTLSGGRPNAATRALPAAEVASGLDELARLHAAYWDRPLPPELSWVHPWRLGPAFAPLSVASLRLGLWRLDHIAADSRFVARRAGALTDGDAVARPAGALTDGDAVPRPEDLDAGRLAGVVRRIGVPRLERQYRASASLASAGPLTLLHGDPHPGNTYSFGESGLGFYDWQLVRVGNWSHDVGYFLAGSLDPVDRRENERSLLTHYLSSLDGSGAGDGVPSFSDAWERYRATPAFGLATWLHTLAFGRLQPVEACLTTISRFAAAYEELETGRSLVARPRTAVRESRRNKSV